MKWKMIIFPLVVVAILAIFSHSVVFAENGNSTSNVIINNSVNAQNSSSSTSNCSTDITVEINGKMTTSHSSDCNTSTNITSSSGGDSVSVGHTPKTYSSHPMQTPAGSVLSLSSSPSALAGAQPPTHTLKVKAKAGFNLLTVVFSFFKSLFSLH